jgi:hypothetical protein
MLDPPFHGATSATLGWISQVPFIPSATLLHYVDPGHMSSSFILIFTFQFPKLTGITMDQIR